MAGLRDRCPLHFGQPRAVSQVGDNTFPGRVQLPSLRPLPAPDRRPMVAAKLRTTPEGAELARHSRSRPARHRPQGTTALRASAVENDSPMRDIAFAQEVMARAARRRSPSNLHLGQRQELSPRHDRRARRGCPHHRPYGPLSPAANSPPPLTLPSTPPAKTRTLSRSPRRPLPHAVQPRRSTLLSRTTPVRPRHQKLVLLTSLSPKYQQHQRTSSPASP